jgi:hypothetical protein
MGHDERDDMKLVTNMAFSYCDGFRRLFTLVCLCVPGSCQVLVCFPTVAIDGLLCNTMGFFLLGRGSSRSFFRISTFPFFFLFFFHSAYVFLPWVHFLFSSSYVLRVVNLGMGFIIISTSSASFCLLFSGFAADSKSPSRHLPWGMFLPFLILRAIWRYSRAFGIRVFLFCLC